MMNIFAAFMARKILSQMYKAMFYYAIIFIFLLLLTEILFVVTVSKSIDLYDSNEIDKFVLIFIILSINEFVHILTHVIYIIEFCLLFREELCQNTDNSDNRYNSYFNGGGPQEILQNIDIEYQGDYAESGFTIQKLRDVVKNLRIFKLTDSNFEKLKSQSAELDKNELTCSICFDQMKVKEECIETYCDKEVEFLIDDVVIKKKIPHIFHQECLLKWFSKGHLSCPICRTHLYQKLLQLNQNFVLPSDNQLRPRSQINAQVVNSNQLRVRMGRDISRDETDLYNMDEQAANNIQPASTQQSQIDIFIQLPAQQPPMPLSQSQNLNQSQQLQHDVQLQRVGEVSNVDNQQQQQDDVESRLNNQALQEARDHQQIDQNHNNDSPTLNYQTNQQNQDESSFHFLIEDGFEDIDEKRI
eukprot:403360249